MSDIEKSKSDGEAEPTHGPPSEERVAKCMLPAAPPANPASKRLHSVGLACIVALALFIRLWGIGWSLPDSRHPIATYHPDERINLSAVQRVDIPHLKLDTGFYNYGTFYFYLVSLSHTVGQSYKWIPTAPSASNPDTNSVQLQQQETSGLFLAGRVVTALMGAFTVIPLFLVGRRLFSAEAGLSGALLYGLAPLAVVHAHYFTVDVPATLFVTLAIWQSARLLHAFSSSATEAVSPENFRSSPQSQPKNGWRELALCGVWVGLASATKYTAGIVLLAPITALALSYFKTTRSGENAPHSSENGKRLKKALLLKLLALPLIVAAVFLIACPGPWLNWNAFWEGDLPASGLRYELFEHSRTGHGLLFVNTGSGWIYHLAVSLPFGLGLPLMAISFAGIGYACWKRSPADWLLLIFLAVSFALTGLSAVRFARYLIPFYPALCLLGARFAHERFCTDWLRKMAPVFGLLVALYTFAYAFTLVRPLTLQDPRDAAADYLETNAKQGASIAFAKTPWFYSPPLSPFFGAPNPQIRAKAAAEVTRFRLIIPASEWDESVLSPPPDYVVLTGFETQHEVERLRMAAPIHFVELVKARYHSHLFPPPAVLGVNRNDPNLPEDLLYALPTVTLYGTPSQP